MTKTPATYVVLRYDTTRFRHMARSPVKIYRDFDVGYTWGGIGIEVIGYFSRRIDAIQAKRAELARV